MNRPSQRNSWVRTLPSMTTSVIVAALLCLAALNMMQRASWSELEDGVLWKICTAATSPRPRSRRGRRPSAPASSAATSCCRSATGTIAAGRRRGRRAAHEPARGARCATLIVRMQRAAAGARSRSRRCRRARSALYLALATVGIFSLLVGASVRLRRPDHQATLHFFWLTVAFFGVMAFSFTGKLDRARLDVLLGGPDRAAAAAAARSCTSRSCFPIGPTRGCAATPGASLVPAIYLPALLLGGVSVAGVINGAHARRRADARQPTYVQIAQLHLSRDHASSPGLAIMVRALRHGPLGDGAPPAALDRVGHGARLGAVRVRLRAAVRVRAASRCAASSSARCCSG